jgi:DNA replication regulator DPB11
MTQGGMYAKALERPIRVTHLLCSGDAETEKMRYAEKFNNAGEARIHLVWEEWFWDSLDFGGRYPSYMTHIPLNRICRPLRRGYVRRHTPTT